MGNGRICSGMRRFGEEPRVLGVEVAENGVSAKRDAFICIFSL